MDSNAQSNTQNIANIETRLRAYFEKKAVALPQSFPCPIPQRITREQGLERYIDHTLLKQGATASDYEGLYTQALAWSPFSVCIPPVRVQSAVEALKGSSVRVCTVVGFPWGYESSKAKAEDAAEAIAQGCHEIDMVISLGELLDANYLRVYDDIRRVVESAQGHLVKVILETSELSTEDILRACFIAGWAGAWFVKTSTGFASGGASIEAVQTMRSVAGDRLGVKASGGIRDRAFTEALIRAGADRIGASATGKILGAESPNPNSEAGSRVEPASKASHNSDSDNSAEPASEPSPDTGASAY